jgi:GlpG protein
MRQLCTLDNEIQAQQFTAYLFTLGISAAVDADTSPGDPPTTSWIIWILEEDDLEQSRKELEGFRENPEDSRYSEAVEQAGQLLKEEAEHKARVQNQQVDIQGRWRNQAANSKRRPLTMTLLLVCGAVFFFSGFGEKQDGAVMQALQFIDLPAAKAAGSPVDRYYSLKQGQVWRLVTPIFIHLSLMHLVFNMLWLYQLGSILESRYMPARFGLLVLFTGIAGIVAQSCMPEEWGGSVLGGGMSGVVFGLLGFLWVKSRYDPDSGLVLNNNVFIFMMVYLVLGFSGVLESFFGLHIGNWAHAGGLVAGMLSAFISIHRR